MDSKIELYDKLLCMACLCVGQPLHQITEPKYQQFYLDTLSEISMQGPLCPSMCYDCSAALKKAVSFKTQIVESYKTLLTYPDENLLEYLKDTGRLDTTEDPIGVRNDGTSNDMFDVGDDASPDQPADIDEVFIKQEMKNEFDDNIDILDNDPTQSQLYDSSADEMDTYISDLKTKKAKLKEEGEMAMEPGHKVKGLKTRKAKRKGKEKPDHKRIIHIDISFEEMMAEREEEKNKRSYIDAAYKCDSCVIAYSFKSNYQTHVDNKHSSGIGNYKCPVCKTLVASVEAFTAHYKRHMRRYECSICQKRTADLKVMHQHYYSKHEISLKEYKCGRCGHVSNSLYAHRYHTDTHRARLPCRDCDKTFVHRAGLSNHRTAVHENRNTYPCKICGKVLRWKASLQRHYAQSHHMGVQKGAGAVCTLCDISFASVTSYKRHLKNSLKHVSADELRFICDHCNRRFADKTKLRDHIEEKHLHKTYHCHICNKPSRNRVGLDQHIRNVHRGRPNNKMCHHCGKGFPTKVQLESHIRTHTGERPFICEFCPTTFSQQSNLYKHNRQVHLNIKPNRNSTKKLKDRIQTQDPAAELQIPTHTIEQPPVVTLLYTPEGFI